MATEALKDKDGELPCDMEAVVAELKKCLIEDLEKALTDELTKVFREQHQQTNHLKSLLRRVLKGAPAEISHPHLAGYYYRDQTLDKEIREAVGEPAKGGVATHGIYGLPVADTAPPMPQCKPPKKQG